jgi:hypothetical protein
MQVNTVGHHESLVPGCIRSTSYGCTKGIYTEVDTNFRNFKEYSRISTGHFLFAINTVLLG